VPDKRTLQQQLERFGSCKERAERKTQLGKGNLVLVRSEPNSSHKRNSMDSKKGVIKLAKIGINRANSTNVPKAEENKGQSGDVVRLETREPMRLSVSRIPQFPSAGPRVKSPDETLTARTANGANPWLRFKHGRDSNSGATKKTSIKASA